MNHVKLICQCISVAWLLLYTLDWMMRTRARRIALWFACVVVFCAGLSWGFLELLRFMRRRGVTAWPWWLIVAFVLSTWVSAKLVISWSNPMYVWLSQPD